MSRWLRPKFRGLNRLLPRLAAIATSLAVLAGAARADSLWVSSAKPGENRTNALEISKVKINRIDDSTATFANPAGRESQRDAGQVVRIAIDDEPTLNAGEEAFVAGTWDVATDNYLKTIKSTQRDWLKGWVAGRLLTAAEKAKRFDAAATAYVTAILGGGKPPAKPAMPDAKSTYLATAAKEVEGALQNPKLSADQRQALLSFLLDLHRTRNDQKGMAEVMQQLQKAGALAANDPAAAGALARMKLDVASVALDARQYKKALDEINANRAIFVNPSDQAQALFLLAQAQEGLAGEDANALADAALAYMRVVAHCKDVPGKPRVAESLMKTASILERTKNAKAALELYQQVTSQFADDPAAAQARESAQRLSQAREDAKESPASAPQPQRE
jgi:TolA-binding protein